MNNKIIINNLWVEEVHMYMYMYIVPYREEFLNLPP